MDKMVALAVALLVLLYPLAAQQIKVMLVEI
jgi:hypothetical protein